MTSTDNPLLQPSSLPYQLPDFAAITTAHYKPAFTAALQRHDAEIAAIATADEPPTWENTVEALERAGRDLDRVSSVFFNLQGTDASEEFDEIAEWVAPQLAAHSDAIYQNEALYQRIEAVTAPDDEESRRLKDHLTRAFRRHGVLLNPADKARLTEINQRLSALAEQFGRNLLAETKALAVHFDNAEELAGLTPERTEAAAAAAAATDDGGGYLIPLELPTIQSAQANLSSPASRARLYEASIRRGTEHNGPVLLETVRLRAERAALLGYRSHADYVIEEETAADAAAANRLLTDLAPAAAANAAGEYKLLAEEAEAHGETVTAADWPYWENQVRRRDFDLDTAEIAKYFPLERVLVDGVFYAAHRLYNISVAPRDDLAGYAEGVRVWEVTDDTTGEGIGLLVTDYFARPTKRGGAWMSSFQDQSRLLGTRPVIINVLNLTPGEELLSLDEVRTLFHEFGHALHGLLSDVTYPTFAGTNVPRDWVEFPSQLNENWAFDPHVVRHYARHVDTGEPIPDRLLDAIRAAERFGQGFATTEYLGAAIVDLAWHQLTAQQAAELTDDTDIAAFERQALADAGLDIEHVGPRYRSTFFNHVFSGGYSAGYYSYLWAEALDADAFDWFRGAEDVRAAGQRFRDLVLATGASRDFGESYRRLRGRDKDIHPLLRRRGLEGTAASE